jgi:hypothetical protein
MQMRENGSLCGEVLLETWETQEGLGKALLAALGNVGTER